MIFEKLLIRYLILRGEKERDSSASDTHQTDVQFPQAFTCFCLRILRVPSGRISKYSFKPGLYPTSFCFALAAASAAFSLAVGGLVGRGPPRSRVFSTAK